LTDRTSWVGRLQPRFYAVPAYVAT
jgi:hypothetical protein